MPFLILFLMISWPVLEVASIVAMSQWIGSLETFLLLAAGFVFGAFLLQSQSRHMRFRMMDAVRKGVSPEKPLLDTGAVSLAGILFMVPGFVSDAAAILLLVPQFRDLIWRGLSGLRSSQRPRQPRWQEPQAARRQQRPSRADDVIDVEFTEVPRGERSGASTAKRAD